MNKLKLIAVLLTGLLLSACESPSDDKGIQIKKKESVIVNIKENDADNINVLTLNYNVYDKDGNLVKTFSKQDTLPYLGTKTDTLDTDVEDSTVVKVVPKKYDYFINFK